jgi:hypothetical protein
VIDQTDGRLRDWVRSVDATVDVSLGPPGERRTGRGVGLYLLGLSERPPARESVRAPLQLWLRYLVTAWAEQPEEAHQLLLEMTFAAMAEPDFEVDLLDLPAEVWTSLGAVPQASFMLRLPALRERPERAAPPVLLPLRVEPGSFAVLEGAVLGPGDTPISGASVRIPALQRSSRTDGRGRFRFVGVPAAPVRTTLIVRAKGREESITVAAEPGKKEPVVVRIDPLEDEDARVSDA